jgi:ABC-type antimicrobial peptide transport system permease subunit
LSGPPVFSIKTSGLTLIAQKPTGGTRSIKSSNLQLVGTSLEQAASHLTLVQGRLPRTAGSSGEIETLLTPATAHNLHVAVGSVITLHGDFFVQPQNMFGGPSPSGALKLQIVGLFNVSQENDPFWSGENFQPATVNQVASYTLLVPNEALLGALDQIAAASHADTVFSPQRYELLWRYSLDVSRIPVDQLQELSSRLTRLQADIASRFSNVQGEAQSGALLPSPYLVQVNLFNPAPDAYELPNTLEQYANRIAILSVPLDILSLQFIALILFFVSLMMNLLVDRQTAAIALLRSRGASNAQIFGSLLTQGIGLAVIALIAAPLLAVAVVALLCRAMLASTEHDAIQLMTGQPVQAAFGVGWYAVVTVLVAIVAMSLVLRRAVYLDVLTLRREATRTTYRPLWQRLQLDVVMALIAFAGYGLSLYLSSVEEQLDLGTQTLVSAPLGLIAPIFFLAGCVLLFLRFFPAFLKLGARLAGRKRRASPALALTHMARAPRQTVRLILLLALTIAFAVFTLVFAASQSQHSVAMAAYEAGADFSGDIPGPFRQMRVKDVIAEYQAIPGAIAATVGYSGEGTAGGGSLPVQIRAVDAGTFAHTAIWTPQDSSQSLASLMAELVAQRNAAIGINFVPVIVDRSAVNTLKLQIGSTFTVGVNGLQYSTLNCLVIDEVEHIPTINDDTRPGDVGSYSPPVGILLDYTTYAAIYTQDYKAFIASETSGTSSNTSNVFLPINHVWLQTRDDAASLAHVRTALTLQTSRLRLENLYDRRALLDALETDPLSLNLITVLTIGATAALLLALLGNMLASWLNVSTRLTTFAVLRALGANPHQIASVLVWEQGIIYTTALLLGLSFGAILSATAIPVLVFTDVPSSGVFSQVSNGEFYILQHVLSAQVVVPTSLEIASIVLIALYTIALLMMVRVVLRPSLIRSLRLNED